MKEGHDRRETKYSEQSNRTYCKHSRSFPYFYPNVVGAQHYHRRTRATKHFQGELRYISIISREAILCLPSHPRSTLIEKISSVYDQILYIKSRSHFERIVSSRKASRKYLQNVFFFAKFAKKHGDTPMHH